MPKVLVTGANGFIGSHLVRELLKRGYEVNCLIRHTSDISSLKGLPVSLHIGDVLEPDSLIPPMRNVEYVFHLAAELMVTSREAFERANVLGTKNVLDAARKHAAEPLKRFLLVSSQAAAGPGKDETPFDETAPPEPISWYGDSKKKAEDAVISFADEFPVTIVRPCAVYGEREKDISQIFPVLERRLHAKLGIRRKYLVMVHVDDVVRGIADAAESDKTINETYFLNHPEVLTAKDVVKITARAMGKPVGLMFPVPIVVLRMAAPFAELIHHFTRNRPRLTRDKAREIAQRFWVNDPSKAKRDFGWEARHTLLEGMKKTVAAFRIEREELRAMPLEKGFLFWLKYVLTAIGVGALFEAISYGAGLYVYEPWFGMFLIIVSAFGVGLGSLALLIRKRSDLLQLVTGTAVTGTVELLNSLDLIPGLSWRFTSSLWPFSVTDIWSRSFMVGVFGGVFILIVNWIMRLLYKRRLRLG